MLELFLCIRTAAISVLCKFTADVHALSLFQHLNAEAYKDMHFFLHYGTVVQPSALKASCACFFMLLVFQHSTLLFSNQVLVLG